MMSDQRRLCASSLGRLAAALVWGCVFSACSAGSTSAAVGQVVNAGHDAAPADGECAVGLPGPELVLIPAAAGSFCIDATEVTQRDYAAFLAAVARRPPAQSAECSWNSVLEAPTFSSDQPTPPGYCVPGAFDPVAHPDAAMVCVDWCDAKAYCEWAGKRLCAGLGHTKETVYPSGTPDPSSGEWQYACTAGGTLRYPYGNDYVAGKCVDAALPVDAPDAGRTGSGACTGQQPPFSRLFDLVGNVEEWTAGCDSQSDSCAARGGYYGDDAASCASYGLAFRQTTHPAIGIRCCADPTPVSP